MEIWHWLVGHRYDLMTVLGPAVFAAALLIILLPILIVRTAHGRAQSPPIPALPWFPTQHFRLWRYAFGHEAWRDGGRYERGLLLLFRTALLVGLLSVTLVFAMTVPAQLQSGL